MKFVSIVAVLTLESLAKKCPDILSYRSQEILDSYSPSKMSGMWYEAAYIDIAQIGSKCQTLNFTVANDTELSS